MASFPEDSQSQVPESNVAAVVWHLVMKRVDLDGSGLVQVFRVLLDRAEECRQIRANCARASEAMLAGREPITQERVAGNALDAIYQTRCLELFLARACRQLAEDLEYDFAQKQGRLPRIKKAIYSDEGEVESFQLEKD